MKTVSLILLILCLLQPVVCFAHPCVCPATDSSGTSEKHPQHQDADNCDLTVCCAEYVNVNATSTVVYLPLVTDHVLHEREHRLPEIVMPIFIPPQNLA